LKQGAAIKGQKGDIDKALAAQAQGLI